MPVWKKSASKRSSKRKVSFKKSKLVTNKKRNQRKNNIYYKPTTTVQTGRLPFAQSYLANFPYSTSSSLNPDEYTFLSSGTQYRLNSLYDPVFAAGGKQPFQFDQLSTVYLKYRVYGAKVEITFNNPTGDGLYVGYHVGFSADPFTPIGKDASYLSEIAKGRLIPINNTGSQTKVMSFYVPINTVFGVPKSQIGIDPNYSSTVFTNPVNQAILTVLALDSTGNATAKNIEYRLKITYYSKMYERVVVAQS